MRLLSFDTSAREITAALLVDGREPALKKVVFAADLEIKSTGKKVSRQESVSLLIPTIDELLKENSLSKAEIDALAVGIGPGGFTGIRVAVATARTIAQALNRPLVGINSLEVMSYGLTDGAQDLVGVIKHASASHCYMAVYRRFEAAEEYDLASELEPSYVPYDQCRSYLPRAGRWYAEEACLARLPQDLDREISLFAPKEQAEGTAASGDMADNAALVQARLAHARLINKNFADTNLAANNDDFSYAKVEPLYLRGASVTLKKGDAVERIESN